MDNAKNQLKRAQTHAPKATFSLDDVRDRRARRERRRRISATVVGLGLTVAIVAGVASVISTSDRQGTPELIHGPLAAPDSLALGPGDYSYQRIRIEGPCDQCTMPTLLVESWWASDDSGRINVLAENGYGIDEGTFSPGKFPDEGDVSQFPTDRDALQAFLLERSGADGASPRPDVTPAAGTPLEEGLLWLAIRDYLGSTQYLNATPELRVAMLRVLANVPMVRVVDDVADPLGRPATSLTFHAYDADLEVFVDPATGDFMALTEAYDSGGEQSVVVEAAGIVDDDHSIPNGAQETVPSEA